MTAAQDVYQARGSFFHIPVKLRREKKNNTTFLHKQNLKQFIIYLSFFFQANARYQCKQKNKRNTNQTYKNPGAAQSLHSNVNV